MEWSGVEWSGVECGVEWSGVEWNCGESRAPSGDHARRSPFCSLQRLRRPLRREPGPPAATTRAAAPSAVSGDCAGHCGESRAPSGDHARRSPFWRLWALRFPRRAPQPLLEALGTAPATRTASGTSGDNARRSPFWRLWVLRLPRGQPAASE